MHDATAEAKRALRRVVRDGRRARTMEQRAEDAAGLTAQLSELVRSSGAQSVTCYVSDTHEPATDGFLSWAHENDVRVLLPIADGAGVLRWVDAEPGMAVRRGAAGVPEPSSAPDATIGPGDTDLILVPAAAVDHSGARLGWGGGYYDRALAELAAPGRVYAVILDAELHDRVPAASHDHPVDGVVTPTRTIAFTEPAT